MYGARDWLVDRGIYLDASVTQFLQGNLAGGRDTGSGRYNGSADYWLTIDTAKAGLWSGAAVFFHAESSWQASRTVNDDAGSLVPANLDASMPTPGVAEAFALPECYLAQGLPADLLLLLGKLDWAGVADTNVFANNERTQFANAGLVNNAILAAFVPYTSLGTAVTFAPPGHALSVFFLQNNGDATTTGADDFKGDYTAGLQYAWSPKWSELPGDYRLILGYTDKTLPAPVPLRDGGDNYTVLVNFDQYLWCSSANQDGEARPGSRRAHLPPLGFGIFGRAGWAPGDRNVADQFYSLGVGGFGTLIPARDGDQWGIGWAATHIASRFRDDARGVGLGLDRFEQALEAFYNFRLTAASHLTVDAQFVDPADRALGSSCMLGIRLQADF
ncbi:MAG TPA: carbohydrate porin [Planctomycetota bacterium]|nr:carbohydrate porin [Planctomycetota bacterium]